MAGVGAGAKSSQKYTQGGNGGTGVGAGRHLTTKTTETNNDVVRGLRGATWSLDAADADADADADAADALIENVADQDDDDVDSGSTTGAQGDSYDSGMDVSLDSPPEISSNSPDFQWVDEQQQNWDAEAQDDVVHDVHPDLYD